MKLSRAGFYWASLDWARGPFYYVVIVAVFSVYFSEKVVGGSAWGQTVYGITVAIAGLVIAVFMPFLGSAMDKGGAKKPVVLVLMLVLAFASMSLALVTPEASYAIPLGMIVLVIASGSFSATELFHNALLPATGTKKDISLVSGVGLSMTGMAAVLVLLTLIVLMENPPLGLTATDIARLSGFVCGVWMLVFLPAFFVGMPDYYPSGGSWKNARFFPEKWRPIQTVKALFSQHRNIMNFLIARMVFMDGMVAFFTIGAVYVAGVLGWTSSETAVLGIIATASAVFGGLLASIFDRTYGPKSAILIELILFMAIFVFQLGISKDSLFFGMMAMGTETSSRELFSSNVDLVYLASIIPQSALIIAAYGSCRSLLVTLSPRDKIGFFFGIYAMTSTITVWVGPALVSLVTFIADSQKLGFGSLMLLFLLGTLLMLRVKVDAD